MRPEFYLLGVSREPVNIIYRDCIGILFPFSLLSTSKSYLGIHPLLRNSGSRQRRWGHSLGLLPKRNLV